MVLYFSGTGNSQHVATRIAEMLADDQVISINRYLKEGRKAALESGRPLIFVVPTYSWRMPKIVEQWILQTSFQGSRDAYFVLTCAGSCGNAAVYAQKLCAKKGLRFCGLSPVQMPENYLALFPTPNESECQMILKRAEPCIAALAEQIQSGQCLPKPSASLKDKLESGLVNSFFYTFFVHDKGFRVSNQCVSCGKCADRCPLNNIGLVGGKPVWKGNCTHCMACIGGCPTKAIEYKSKSKGRYRHYIMNDSFAERTEVEFNEERTHH